MKRVFLTACLLAVSALTVKAQEQRGGYTFVDESVAPHTPCVGQGLTGNCWNFSGTSFIESELKRQGKGEFDLAEMWVTRHAFMEKAKTFMLRGRARSKGSGGSTDVYYIFKNHGIVPEEAYPGLNYGTDMHKHWELNSVINAYVQGVNIGRRKDGGLSTVWTDGLNNILDAYFGEIPEKFTYKGKEYTPKSFTESLNLNTDDFVNITSYSHKPYYAPYMLELSGNWVPEFYYNYFYNLPLDEMMEVMEYALANGCTLSWNADITNPGYCKEKGICVYPVTSMADIPESKRAEWAGYTDEMLQKLGDRENKKECFTRPVVEYEVTQEMRQRGYEAITTCENHCMHIVGLCRDQNGNRFYKIKNSAHGKGGIYYEGGYYYCSVPYMRYFTMSLVVHKDGVPAHIAEKLGLKK